MTEKKETVPVPSMVNYPEDSNPDYIMGFEKDGERVKVPEEGPGNIILTGAVSGSGPLGTSVSTNFSYPLNAGNNRITNVSNPSNLQDAATKNYVDSQVGSSKQEYALGWRISEMSANFNSGNPAYWDAFESNTTKIAQVGIGNFYRITLSSGYVYKLMGFVSILEAPPYRIYRRFRWYNVSTGSYFGSQGGFANGTDTSYSGGGSGAAIAYIKPTSTITLELRCSYSYTDSDYIEYGTSFNVEVLNATSL
jgi:hypothetical protein